MMSSYRLVATVLLSLLAVHSTAEGQTQNGSRAQVGLALSGGSALGLAHIGVIRYFEEHHIPIDDIGGTSMGGLVGGFYAIGMDSKQLTQVVEQANWDDLLSPMPRFADQPIVNKQRWNKPSGNLSVRFGKNFSLPAGLNPGISLSLLLSRTMLAYSNTSDFNELPTPFRCVATDLVSGDGVVLKSGALAQALRATMSLPGIFTPVKLDGMVLVDGGVVQNIPVDVVREMGAQVVIAVALKTPKVEADRLKTVPDVLRQTVAVVVSDNERRSLAHADLVISVDTAKFGGSDYRKSQEIIQAGYDAAKQNAEALKKYEVSTEEWESYVQRRNQRIRQVQHRGPLLVVNGPTPSFQEKANSEIVRKLDSRVVDEKQLDDVLTGMVAATAVPGATYEWQKDSNGNGGFKVEFSPRPGDQYFVQPSVQYSVSANEPSRAALRLSTATVHEGAYKSRFLATMNIGYDPSIRTEFYHPFGGSPYFIAPGLFVERYNVNSYLGGSRTSDTRDRFGGSLYGGIGTWRFVQLRMGVQAGYDSYSSSRVVDGMVARNGAFASPELRWVYNTQDSGGLPSRGTHIEGATGYSFRNNSYPFLRNDFSTFQPAGSRLTWFVTSQIGTSYGTKLNYFEQFTGGGFGQLGAFRYQEFHANTMLESGAGVILHAPAVERLSIYPRLAVWYEAGRFDLGSKGWQTHQSTSAGIFFPTPVGTAGVALGFDEQGRARFRLVMGTLW